MARVSTSRTRAAKRDLINAEYDAGRSLPPLRLRWGRISASILALGSGVGFMLLFLHMLGEFMDRL